MKQLQLVYTLVLFLTLGFSSAVAQSHNGHNHDNNSEATHTDEEHKHNLKDEGHKIVEEGHDIAKDIHEYEKAFDPGATAMHHIGDANVYSIGPLSIPLPCIVKVKGEGFKVFSSAKFKPGHHGDGKYSYKNFVLNGGTLNRISDPNFPEGKQEVTGFGHKTLQIKKVDKEGKIVLDEDGQPIITEKEVETVILKDGSEFVAEGKSTLDGGLFGGGMTSWMDFSLTKNVVTMLIVFALLALMFISISKAYTRREGSAPSGLQSFVEPIFAFIQDEVAKPILGDKWEKYQPFLMALFFFILGLNLFGQVPFFGGSNASGHISVTIALALFTAVIVNFSGNKDYWGHIFNMPGVPFPVKLILTPVEILGVFLKPMTLFIRLFGNISAGHMVMAIFVSLIFVFGKSGESLSGSLTGIAMSVPLTLFMLGLELLVAFLQAFVFTILTAVYIGAAVEEHH